MTVLAYATWDNDGTNKILTLDGNASELVPVDEKLQVSFTAPESGAVAVTQSGNFEPEMAGSGNWWGLLDDGTPVAGASSYMGTANDLAYRATTVVVVTGLTPGDPYVWDFAWAGNEDARCHLRVGPGDAATGNIYGPLNILVTALP